MRYLLFLHISFFSFTINAQNICIDSSSHIQYKTLLNDSLRIEKTILTKDSSKISIGFFINGIAPGKSFIFKIDKKGEVMWFKKITAPFGTGSSDLEAIEEANNGNIFITTCTEQADNKPYFYLVFSASGNLIYQNKIGFSNIPVLGTRTVGAPLLSRFSQDSMLLGFFTGPESGEGDLLTLMTTDNAGNTGDVFIFKAPPVTIFGSYFSRCLISGNVIDLYGSAAYWNSCMVNFREHPVFAHIKIDWSTKQVLQKKAFCSPLEASWFGYFNGQGETFEANNCRQIIFFQANGNIVMSRSYMGLEFNGADTVNRLYSISEFDSNFNHIKSEYLITGNQFKRDCYYDLFIDSFNKRHIRIHDLPNKKIYYAKGSNANTYYFQKNIPFTSLKKNGFTTKQNFLEPGFSTSFNIISSDNQHSYIDNFRILIKDTAASCFGDNLNFLNTKLASVSPINWQGNFTIQQAIIESAPTNFTIEDYSLQRTIVCNIVNKCDTIKLNAPDTVCNITQPVIITAHKNPLCSGKVNFIFDTTQVQSYTQINDTTLSLSFNKSYRGKIFAKPGTCDKLIDSVTINVFAPGNPINLGKDTTYCSGKTYTLNAYNPDFEKYLWQDGSTDSVFTAATSGTFYVTATDFCNRSYNDTIKIINKPNPVNIGKDSTICKSESILLSVPSGYLNYNWQPQYNITPVAPNKVTVSPEVNTSYQVEAEIFLGCKLRDTINIKVENCPQYIYFPSSFTPNNDDLNDTFKPLVGGAMIKYELQIYNRWGQLVFRTTNKNEGWTGKLKEAQQGNATFAWICKYQFYGKPEKLIKGTLVLIR